MRARLDSFEERLAQFDHAGADVDEILKIEISDYLQGVLNEFETFCVFKNSDPNPKRARRLLSEASKYRRIGNHFNDGQKNGIVLWELELDLCRQLRFIKLNVTSSKGRTATKIAIDLGLTDLAMQFASAGAVQIDVSAKVAPSAVFDVSPVLRPVPLEAIAPKSHGAHFTNEDVFNLVQKFVQRRMWGPQFWLQEFQAVHKTQYVFLNSNKMPIRDQQGAFINDRTILDIWSRVHYVGIDS